MKMKSTVAFYGYRALFYINQEGMLEAILSGRVLESSL